MHIDPQAGAADATLDLRLAIRDAIDLAQARRLRDRDDCRAAFDGLIEELERIVEG